MMRTDREDAKENNADDARCDDYDDDASGGTPSRIQVPMCLYGPAASPPLPKPILTARGAPEHDASRGRRALLPARPASETASRPQYTHGTSLHLTRSAHSSHLVPNTR